MPVETPRPDYAAAEEKWIRCRDAYGGSDTVKARSTLYLPKLGGQKGTDGDTDYANYLLRANFYNATRRTVTGLTGAVMRREPQHLGPDAVAEQLNDVTSNGHSITRFVTDTLTELLTVGRAGVWLDMAENAGVQGRPYWIRYAAEQIVNWSSDIVQGRRRLTLVVLKELREVMDPEDAFKVVTQTQYRELRLMAAATGEPVYTVTVHTQDPTNESRFIAAPTLLPTRRGVGLPFIPFRFVPDIDISDPPLLDLVDVNFSHYRSEADLEWGAHFTSLPTPYVVGAPENTELRIGSTVAWALKEVSGATAGYLEFKGDGLRTLERRIEHKEHQMAALGARLLEHQAPAGEAAETVRLRHRGEDASLKDLTLDLSAAFTDVLRMHVWWAGLSAELDAAVSVSLNTDFVSAKLSAEDLKALLLSWQAGGISYDTFYAALEKGEWTIPGRTLDVEREAIDAEAKTREAIEAQALADAEAALEDEEAVA